jgi:hypothetical protein
MAKMMKIIRGMVSSYPMTKKEIHKCSVRQKAKKIKPWQM